MKTVKPIGKWQAGGPRGFVRFRSMPPLLPGEQAKMSLCDAYALHVHSEEIGESGYCRARIVGSWKDGRYVAAGS